MHLPDQLILGLETFDIKKDFDPVRFHSLDVDQFIKDHNCMEVTSHNINVASTTDLHPQGIFSEEIFGQIGSPERLIRFGYIRLNVKIYQPIIYKTIIKLKQLYSKIMSGMAYAKFDEEEMDFIACSPDDPDGNTGWSFFVNNFPKVRLEDNNSLRRRYKVKLLEKYADAWYCDKFLVIPAGLRDLKATDGVLSQEDVNKLYLSLLSYADRIPPNTKNVIYDTIKYSLMKKANEIDDYIENIVSSGKKSYIRGTYGKRAIAFGTGNVLSAHKFASSGPGDVRELRHDETICPLFQTIKSFQPFVIYYLQTLAFNDIFPHGSINITAINKKTLKLEYITVSETESNKFKTSEGIEDWLNAFRNVENRKEPISIRDEDNLEYYLYLIYEDGDTVMMFRNIDDVKKRFPNASKKNVRPLTWVELLYIATYVSVQDKHAYIVRYPIGQGPESIYPSKIRLIPTEPNKLVYLHTSGEDANQLMLPHYPILEDSVFMDSISIHPSCHVNLASDHDGDMVPMNSVFSKDANEEIAEYMNSWRSIISPQQKLMRGMTDHIINEVVCAMTFDPEAV